MMNDDDDEANEGREDDPETEAEDEVEDEAEDFQAFLDNERQKEVASLVEQIIQRPNGEREHPVRDHDAEHVSKYGRGEMYSAKETNSK